VKILSRCKKCHKRFICCTTISNNTYRCLTCGRMYEKKDVIPFNSNWYKVNYYCIHCIRKQYNDNSIPSYDGVGRRNCILICRIVKTVICCEDCPIHDRCNTGEIYIDETSEL